MPAFTRNALVPCLYEVAKSKPLLRDFTVTLYDAGQVEGVHWIHGEMTRIMRAEDSYSARVLGPILVIEERDPTKLGPLFAGRFMVAPRFQISGDDIYVSPMVMFEMKFDGKLHKFMHRYDNAIANHRVEDVTRTQIQNHILDSFTFYRMHAFSDTRPW